MSLVLTEGFDYLAPTTPADLLKRGWIVTTGGLVVASGSGRRGTKGAQLYSSGWGGYKVLPGNYTTVIAGIGYIRNAATGSTPHQILGFFDTAAGISSAHIGVRLNEATGCLSVVRGNGTILATDTLALAVGQFYYIELKVLFHASAGAYELRVAGVTRLSGSGVQTTNSANAYANAIMLGGNSSNYGSGADSITCTFDDIYVCDTSGSVNNDFLGDCRVDFVLPTSDGYYSDFTPSTGTDNYATVDESSPNTADYASSNVFNAKDSYGMQDLTSLLDPAVFGVQPVYLMNTNYEGSRHVAPLVRSGGVDSEGSASVPGTTSRYFSGIFELNPNGSVSWTQSSVNAAEFGVSISV